MSSTDSSIPGTTLIVLIVAAALICLVTVLGIVLLVVCIKYHKRTKMVRPSSNLSVTVPNSEASKHYIVESGTGKGVREVNLQPISHKVVPMKENLNYHQLRTNSNGGGKSPDSVVSLNLSHLPQRAMTSVLPFPEITVQAPCGYTDRNTSGLTTRYSANDVSAPPKSSQQCYLDLPDSADGLGFRAHSETQLSKMSNDLGNYGPLYGNEQYQSEGHRLAHVSPSNVKIIGSLGVGNFGSVHLGHTVGLSARDLGLGEDEDTTRRHEVAVKTLQANPSQDDNKSFRKEVKCMSKLRHPNVVQILAVCWEREEQFILLEYMQNGDLYNFLKYYNSVNMGHETYGSTISYHKLVHICTQIASAMEYLASRKFVHRDLATRNCLVGDDFFVKVADFGLSRNLYNSCYYRFQGSAVLPIRWMAPECFMGRFSEKTDVWAYGVTMWEVFSLCKEVPHPQLSDQEIIQEVLRGSLPVLERPECCGKDMYDVMRKCLEYNYTVRTNFNAIHLDLLKVAATLS